MPADRILFVDDDPEILKNYQRMFAPKKKGEAKKQLDELFSSEQEESHQLANQSKYRVETANQGQLGVDLVQKGVHDGDRFKVAFIDMRMPPGIDGKKTAELMRTIDPDLEIVIVTAYSDHDFEKVVDDIGAADRLLYLKKPFDPAEIKQFALGLTTKWNEARIKDEFLANVSHELKTPLSSIIGFSDLILGGKELGDDEREYAKIIKESGLLMKFFIEDLITLVSLGKSEISLDKKKFDVSEVLLDAIQIFKPAFDKKPAVGLDVSMVDTDLFIDADPQRVKQCFINFLSNALKYTMEGQIKISTHRENGNVLISFQDSGIGMDNSELDHIFERFERLEKDHHAIPGLGLGLSICKKIADLHGAEIRVVSQKNKGSVFTLILPEAV